MRSMGEQRSKENTQWVVWVELLSVKSLDAQVLELYFFPVQSKEHTRTSWQGSLLILCLVSPPFSLSLSVGADYDVHSLLSSWFWLVCNQRRAPVSYRPCCCSPDYIRVHYCISSFFRGVWLLLVEIILISIYIYIYPSLTILISKSILSNQQNTMS